MGELIIVRKVPITVRYYGAWDNGDVEVPWTNWKPKKCELALVMYADKTEALQLIGGPTGYESISLEELSDNLKKMLEGTKLFHGSRAELIKRLCIDGWNACMGTKHRWDRADITGEEMQNALIALGLVDKDWAPVIEYGKRDDTLSSEIRDAMMRIEPLAQRPMTDEDRKLQSLFDTK